eukprot:m.105185 g.105185  ORF g.105185 m.105185 type:complete len:73 (+) comp15275_c0_seq1:158-376(+)
MPHYNSWIQTFSKVVWLVDGIGYDRVCRQFGETGNYRFSQCFLVENGSSVQVLSRHCVIHIRNLRRQDMKST